MRGGLRRSGIGQAACNVCPLARICSVKNPEACNPNQIAQQAGGEYTGGDSAEVSYKKVLDDDRINVVIANVKKKEQTKPKAQRPPEAQRPPAHTITMPPVNVIKAPPARPKMATIDQANSHPADHQCGWEVARCPESKSAACSTDTKVILDVD